MSAVTQTILEVCLPPVVLWALARVDQLIRAHVHDKTTRTLLLLLDDAVEGAVKATDQVMVASMKAGGKLTDGQKSQAMSACARYALDLLGKNATTAARALGGDDALMQAIVARAEARLAGRTAGSPATPSIPPGILEAAGQDGIFPG